MNHYQDTRPSAWPKHDDGPHHDELGRPLPAHDAGIRRLVPHAVTKGRKVVFCEDEQALIARMVERMALNRTPLLPSQHFH